MKTYLAYTRVSTTKQGQGSSLQEQKSAIEAYAQKHDLQIVGWFEEMETAAKQGRRMFNQVLTELGKGRLAGVIIHKIDRSARNLKDWATVNDLIDRGIEVHFAHESLDMHTRGGRLAADIQAVVAADFIRNNRDETRKGMYGRLKQGLYPLPAPRGYQNNGKGKPKTIDPVLGPLVRQAFELYGTATYSLHTLRAEMARRGLRANSGKPLSLCALATILHSPFYIGIIRLTKTNETFQGVHEPLITKALYDRVQGILSGRFHARVRKHDLPFRRMIRCAACGYALIGEVQKGHAYYRCHSASCRGTSIREEVARDTLGPIFELLALTDEELGDLRDLVKDTLGDVARSREQAVAEIKQQLGKCEDRQLRLTDAFLDGVIDKDSFESRKASLLTERRDLLDKLEAPDAEPTAVKLLRDLELGNTAQQQFQSPIVEEMREAVREVTSNLIAEGKDLAVRLRYPFDEVAKERLSQIGAPYRVVSRTDGTLCIGQ